jgi:FdrA protein
VAAGLPVVVSVIGTRDDPQDTRAQCAALTSAGAAVHLSNAAATRAAIDLLGAVS